MSQNFVWGCSTPVCLFNWGVFVGLLQLHSPTADKTPRQYMPAECYGPGASKGI